jgi:hypothetical protein
MNPNPNGTLLLESWENLWQTLHQDGWHLSHYAYRDSESGCFRHLVRARKKGDELICTAPTFIQAFTLIFTESRGDTSILRMDDTV